jgi:hypothetical protein
MERPIIFNDAMVRAILSGAKTETRRPVTPQPVDCIVSSREGDGTTVTSPTRRWGKRWIGPDLADLAKLCPFGMPGDTLWVREAWRVEWGDTLVYFRADGASEWLSCDQSEEPDVRRWSDKLAGGLWAPSIHMPRWAARTVLDVLEVRVERLQSMSEEDARAEGFETRAAFCGTWDAIYPTMGMRHNPWVWVVRFKRQGGA